MRNHGVDPRPDTVCSWLAQRAMRVLLRQENSRRRDQIAGHRIPPLRYIESELKDQPESEELGQKGGVHLHGDIAVNFERIDNRYLRQLAALYAEPNKTSAASHFKRRQRACFQKIIVLKMSASKSKDR